MGNKLITVGTRHIKVWKVEEPTSTIRFSKARQSDVSFLSGSTNKTLPGRNCILDGLRDATFTSVVAVAQDKAIVASDRGEICLIDDSSSDQRLSKRMDAGFAVSSMAADTKGRLHFASSQGSLKTINISEILGMLTPPPSPSPQAEPSNVSITEFHQVGAIGCLENHIVTVDAQRAIHISHLCPANDPAVVGEIAHTLPAHGNAVLGVNAGLSQPNALEASYYTWAANGTIIFWSQDTFRDSLQVPLEQVETPDAILNELRTVRVSTDGKYLVSGDKFGVLRIIDCKTKTSVFDFKAHASEITSIAIHEEQHFAFVACASRDRTVQVFTRRNQTWDLLQTLDEHVGAVNGVSFSRNGTRLISSSGDRNLVVRELVSREDGSETIRAFVMLRAIMLKASPVSMAWDVDQDDALLVSTIDRQVHKFDIQTGQSLVNFRACDADGGDAVVLSSLVSIPRDWSSPLIAGVSSTDKSIRIYDENGSLIARDWGHTEGVSDIALVQNTGTNENELNERSLVTVAVDGTIFVWALALQAAQRNDLSKSMDLLGPSTPLNQDILANKPPLRRVFSQSELARFQRSPDSTITTPTGNKSPKLRKKLSKFSLFQAPKLEPSPISNSTRDNRTAGWQGVGSLRRKKTRSPSPPSPRSPQNSKRRASVDVRPRTKAPVNEFGSIGASTESLCRTLRAYRKRLANTNDTMSSELAKEVERELAATARAIGERVKSKEFEETVMVKLLDQYSERLVTMLDEKIAASVAQRVRDNSVTNLSSGANSPVLGSNQQEETDTCEGSVDASVDESTTPTDTLVSETTEKLVIR